MRKGARLIFGAKKKEGKERKGLQTYLFLRWGPHGTTVPLISMWLGLPTHAIPTANIKNRQSSQTF